MPTFTCLEGESPAAQVTSLRTLQHQPPESVAAQVMLLSDGSVTRHLQLMTGVKVAVVGAY